MKEYKSVLDNIDETFTHVRQLTQITKQKSHIEDVIRLQNLLTLDAKHFKEEAKLPCIILPPAKNSRFYNRDGLIGRMEEYFSDPSKEHGFRSIALYGVGGVGKSHVALKYAYLRAREHKLDAVLWMHSETRTALAQSFTDAGLRLKLPGIERRKQEENRIIVLNWLQQTCKTTSHLVD